MFKICEENIFLYRKRRDVIMYHIFNFTPSQNHNFVFVFFLNINNLLETLYLKKDQDNKKIILKTEKNDLNDLGPNAHCSAQDEETKYSYNEVCLVKIPKSLFHQKFVFSFFFFYFLFLFIYLGAGCRSFNIFFVRLLSIK